MKIGLQACLLLSICFTCLAHGETKRLVLNKNFGFDVEGYNYEQSYLPCSLENSFVSSLVAQAEAKQIEIEVTGLREQIINSQWPVLAIDIDHLVLGTEEHSYGKKSKSNIPSVGITAAVIRYNKKNTVVTTKHSCAQLPLVMHNPAAENVLDLGTYGKTVCSVIQDCAAKISEDVLLWADGQIDAGNQPKKHKETKTP